MVHRTVACLAQGGVVGHGDRDGLYPGRQRPAAAGRRPAASAWRGPGPTKPGRSPCCSRAPRRPPTGFRRSRWSAGGWPGGSGPGPLTLAFPPGSTDGLFGRLPAEARRLISPEGGLALRNSADPFVRGRARAHPRAAGHGQPRRRPTSRRRSPPTRSAILGGLDMVIDSGPTHLGRVSTRVRIDDDRWAVEREGAIDASNAPADVRPDHPLHLHGQHLPQPDGRGHLQAAPRPTARLHHRPARRTRLRRALRGGRGHQRGSRRRACRRRAPVTRRLARDAPQPAG